MSLDPHPYKRPPQDVFVEQTSDHPRLVSTVLGTLERERASLVEQLASVRAKDYAEYLGRFSQIDGLNIAISHIMEAAKKLG